MNLLEICLVLALVILITKEKEIYITDIIQFHIPILWKHKGESSKYQDIIDFIRMNSNNPKLLEFEEKLQQKSELDYKIYKYRFRDHKSFRRISDLVNLENPRIVEHLDKIALSMRLQLL